MILRNGSLLVALIALAVGPLARAEERPVLELSLDEAVERALKNNVDIAVQRFGPESAAESVREAQGIYDPLLTATVSQTSETQPARSVFQGAEKVDTNTTTYNLGASQMLPTGADVSLTFANSRSDTNASFQTYNPAFYSTFEASLKQPLLRNRATDSRRYQLKVAKKNREISDVQFHQTVVNTIAGVKQLYYDLIFAIDNLAVQKKSLDVAQKFLEENRIKVRVGTLAPLDVVQAEAEAASREETVILAEAALQQAEDDLKRAVFPKNDPATWALRVAPTDKPTAEKRAIDVEAAVTTALTKRTDITAARKNLEIAEAAVALARNGKLPAVDLIASYGTIGAGGTHFLYDPNDPLGASTGSIPGGYGDAVSQVFGRDFPTWTIGANVSIPILNRAGRGAAARATIARDQQETALRRLELQVAAEVRAAARSVESSFKRVESTRAARTFASRYLDAEQKKFSAGMSTSFFVTQAQRDLAIAEGNEVRAVADYSKSLITFDRVQESAGGSASF